MKVSKQRAKARSAFKRPRNIQYKDEGGTVHPERFYLVDNCHPAEAVIPVVVIRGRAFTRPQCARQRDS